MESINEVLSKIQSELKAPKDKYNNFAKFYYRSCEGILEGLKPLLAKYEACIVVSDTLIHFGVAHPSVLIKAEKEDKLYNADRFYVRATATLKWKDQEISANSYAREEDHKKGMDSSQLTGATSSYARKYALNGLLAIDDTKDADYGAEAPTVSKKVSNKQLGVLRDMLLAAELKESPLCKYLGVEGLEDTPESDYNKAVKAIEAKGKK